jgi:hypothetical protein
MNESKIIRKPYEKPVIETTETLEARAVVCTRSDTAACGPGTATT